VLGGVHATFMYKQVLPEAPWIDAIVRGEGEEIMVAFARRCRGRWPAERATIKGIAYLDDGKVVATPPRRPSRTSTASGPGLGHPELGQVHLHPAGCARRHPQHGARLPLHLLLLQPVEILARLPHPRPQEGGGRDRGRW
jgi:radical SAM superfamily enzyme YgiQ (UPF0313 family)